MPNGGCNPTAARLGLCVAALLLPLFGPVAVGARQVVATRDLDCADFATQAEAQRVLDRDPSDPYGLDGPPGPESTGEPGVACDDDTAVAQPPAVAVAAADGSDAAIAGGALPAAADGAGSADGTTGGAAGPSGGGAGAAGAGGGVVVVGDGTGGVGGAVPPGAGTGTGEAAAVGAVAVAATAAQPPADLDCEHFATQADAQLVLDDDPSDPYDLDPDGNGIACDAAVAAPTTAPVGYAVPSDIDWPIPARVGALTTPVRLAPGRDAAVVGPALAGAPVEILGPIQIAIAERRGYVPIRTGAGVVGWVWLRYLDPTSIGASVPFAPMATIVDAAPPVAPTPPATPPDPAAPAPPPAPVPGEVTAEEQAYLDALLPILATMADSAGRAGLLLQNPLPADPTWANRITAEFVVWDQSYAAANALDPPRSLRSAHRSLVDAYRIYAEEGPVIAAAIAAVDAAALTDSAGRLAAANATIGAATEQIDAFEAAAA